jgi:hypothetical protein
VCEKLHPIQLKAHVCSIFQIRHFTDICKHTEHDEFIFDACGTFESDSPSEPEVTMECFRFYGG